MIVVIVTTTPCVGPEGLRARQAPRMPALSGGQDPARPLSLSSRITLGSSSMLIEQAEHSPKHSRAEASALYLLRAISMSTYPHSF